MQDKTKKDQNGLGARIRDHLVNLGIETPINLTTAPGWKQGSIAEHVKKILGALDLDLQCDDLRDTPQRVAHMFVEEIFYGLNYDNFPKITTTQNSYKFDEMIVSKCQVKSMCMHHLIPFMGTSYVSYIPGEKIIGLSKLNRIVDFFSRRPQVQERLTEQVSATLQYVLKTKDVAVVIKAQHFCVQLRGVQDSTSITTTSKLSGKFRDVPEARQEFLALTRS